MLSPAREAALPRPLQAPALAILWAAGAGALFVVRLGAAPLFDVDEGAFAEATRELATSGDWLHTTLNGAPRFDKPILVYWLQAAAVAVLGPGEAAVRLPSALCAWGWCLAVARFAWPRLGPGPALLAGTIAATSGGVVAIGRAATADALLNLLLVLAAFDAWRHLDPAGPGRRAPLWRAYLWVGLGLLAKGPVALLVPAAATGLWAATSGAGRRWARAAFDLRGWLVLLAVAGPWYAYALHRHGMAFVDGFLVRHNVARYTTVLEGHGGSAAYYALALPVLLLPWSPLLAPVLARARRSWREPLPRFLLGWAAFVLVFFSLSGTKLPHYALYGATPLFLLVAREAGSASRIARGAVLGAIGLLLALLAALPWAAQGVAPHLPDALASALLSGAAALAPAWYLPAIALAGAGWWAASRRWRTFPARAAAGAVAVAGVLAIAVVPWVADVLQGPVKRAALAARLLPAPAVQWRVHVPSFAFYRGEVAPRRPPGPGELAITRYDRLLPEDRVEVLYQERGYALVLAPGR